MVLLSRDFVSSNLDNRNSKEHKAEYWHKIIKAKEVRTKLSLALRFSMKMSFLVV
jgi:hypothetical protein